ncbi:MAG: GNAT family N-acetyltransferase [Acidimicrobiales bacterium]
MTAAAVRLRHQPTGSGAVCRGILAALPTWFGIPESVEDYVAVADRTPTVIASLDGGDVGFVTVFRHTAVAAEIYAMGVLPEHHRRGIGRIMVTHAEEALARDGVEFLQVKTLGPSRPDEGYRRTRAFYEECGFRPLQEFSDLWGPDQPALQMVKVVRSDP